jgi:H+-transporting ATPase
MIPAIGGLIAGFLVPAIGWELAGLVWGWALVEFVVTDFIKVPVFKRF